MKKEKKSFSKFYASLPADEKNQFKRLIDDWSLHIALTNSEKRLLIEDAKKAVVYLYKKGFSVEKILSLVDSSNLGGFYAHEALAWFPLDDAAKIYPLSMKYGQMPMFRLSCTLVDDVVPEMLQLALDFTIKRFPSFATIVRKGAFWHYLDSVKRRFTVYQETTAPCAPFKIGTLGAQSFKVLYYKKRISVEFFHVLTDGTGGLIFLKTLVAEYLRLLGANIPCSEDVLDVNEAPDTYEIANEFERLCPKAKRDGGFAGKPALQMSGKIAKRKPARVVSFTFETDKLKEKAKSFNSTVTGLILTLMFKANKCATEVSEGKIQIQVPVNMRKFYQSRTLRNFAMYCSVDIPAKDIGSIEDLVPEIKKQLCEKTTFDEMSVMMTTAHKLVTSLKFIPLMIKVPAAKVIYGYLGDSRFSNTLSNIGVVKMPEEAAKKIDSFDFVLGTGNISRASCTLCTFENKTVFTVSKATTDPCFEEAFNRLVSEIGLEAKITGSPVYD